MKGRTYLSHVAKLRLDREEPGAVDRARFIVEAIQSEFAAHDFKTTLFDDDLPHTVEVHVVDKEHRNMDRVLEEAARERFGIGVERLEPRHGNERFLFHSEEWF